MNPNLKMTRLEWMVYIALGMCYGVLLFLFI